MNIKKGRYGRFVKYAISAVDYAILNGIYYLAFYVLSYVPQLHEAKAWTIANIAYLLSLTQFAKSHDTRIVYSDKIVVTTLQMCLTYGMLFCAGAWLLQIPGSQLSSTILYIVALFIVLSIWWLVSRSFIRIYRKHGFNYKKVVIVGNTNAGRALVDEMSADSSFGYMIMGIFDDAKPSSKLPLYGGSISDVEAFIKDHNIDELYYTLKGNINGLMEEMIRVSEANAVDFFYVPQVGNQIIRRFEANNVGNIPTLSVRKNPLRVPINKLIKRTFDLTVSIIAILLIIPTVLIPIIIGIKLSSKGPVLFKQQRTGYRGKSFTCYKFRTMRVNDKSDTQQASKNDVRKTKFGSFLRKTSLDELPQFLNVLKGDMSIVGPRPHMIAHTQQYSALIEKYMLRHTVKPGITGWAQVNGFRGETPHLWQMQKRVEYDVWYTENWNAMLDVWIIIRTITNGLTGDPNAN